MGEVSFNWITPPSPLSRGEACVVVLDQPTYNGCMMNQNQNNKPAKPNVLLVDDNVQNLELLEAYMEELEEVRVVTATNGLDAMTMVAEHAPDMILLDIMMPKMSGFEVCKRIKSDPKTRDIIIIMVTALNETSDVERAAECGTDDYLSKPVDKAALIRQVRKLLSSKFKA